MADTSLFARLQRLFSTNVIVRNVGGKNLKVADIKTAGVPNYKVKTLIIDIKSDPRYFERSI